jgi:hypothetical protein
MRGRIDHGLRGAGYERPLCGDSEILNERLRDTCGHWQPRRNTAREVPEPRRKGGQHNLLRDAAALPRRGAEVGGDHHRSRWGRQREGIAVHDGGTGNALFAEPPSCHPFVFVRRDSPDPARSRISPIDRGIKPESLAPSVAPLDGIGERCAEDAIPQHGGEYAGNLWHPLQDHTARCHFALS